MTEVSLQAFPTSQGMSRGLHGERRPALRLLTMGFFARMGAGYHGHLHRWHAALKTTRFGRGLSRLQAVHKRSAPHQRDRHGCRENGRGSYGMRGAMGHMCRHSLF